MSTLTRALGLLAAACAVASCRPDAARSPGTEADSVGAAESGAETFFRYGLIPFEATRSGMRGTFGEPDSVIVKAVKNRHDPEITDSIATVHYPGMSAEIYLATYGRTELTSHVTVTDNRYVQDTAPVRIGMPAAELDAILGPPTDGAGRDTRIYLCDTCTELGNDHLLVRVTGGRVSAITVQYSID